VCGLFLGPPVEWGAALLGLGALTGVLGIALAVAQQDLKRLLAYSSIENVGVIVIGVGLASIGRSLGRADLVALGLGGALFHVLNHSLFKPLLFMAAGSVLHATGTRQVSLLGGLARRMPYVSILFAIGAVAICGLPPLNGFASELLLYVGLLHATAVDPATGWAWASLAAPALAMIGALAVAGFVKVAGIVFGGTARSPAAARAHDPEPGMLASMLALAGACVLLGLVPSVAVPLLQGAVAAWDPLLGNAAPPLPELAPFAWVSGVGVTLVLTAALVAALFSRRRSERPGALTWDCGYVTPTPRMQYVGSSFSETLVELFDWVVRSRRATPDLSGPFPQASRFSDEVPEVVFGRVGPPLVGAAERGLSHVRALQRGPVQMYLLYLFLAVVLTLVVAR
jgi:hydrogenase-4 component B